MAFTKFGIVLLLAIAATSQAARRPDPRDLRVVIVKAIQIADIIGEKLADGIAEAKPIIIELEGELNPDLAQDVHDLLTKLETDVNQIVDRLNFLEDEVLGALGAVETEAAPCVSAADISLDKVLDVAEKNLSTLLKDLKTKYESNYTSVKTQIVDTFKALDVATDKAIVAGVACVKKGSTTVKKCLDDNSAEWNSAVSTAVINLTLVLNEAVALIQEVLPQVITPITEIGAALKEQADPTWVDFGTCVQNLS